MSEYEWFRVGLPPLRVLNAVVKGVSDLFVVLIDNLSLIDVRALRKSPNKRYATVVHMLYRIMLSYHVSCRERGAFLDGGT